MIIKKIEIENFRSIKNKVTIDDVASTFRVLIGPNNSGKSNILRAINLFFNLETEPEVKFNPIKDISIGNKRNCNISLFLKFTNEKDKRITSFIDKNYPDIFKNYYIPLTLRLYPNGTVQYIFTNQKGQKSTKMTDLKDRLMEYINCIYIPAIKDYKKVINKDMMQRIVASSFHGWGRGRTSKKLGKHKEDFTKTLEDLQKILDISGDLMTEMFADVVSNIKRFDFSLPYDNLEDFLGRLFFQITESGLNEKVSLDSEGSGIQSYTIYSMLKLLHELRPTNTHKNSQFLWLIEEPETFMHHDLQRKTFNKLKNYSNDGHIFITTHSPVFIDKVDYKNSIEVIKSSNETKLQKVSAKNVRNLITGSLGVGFDELGLFKRFNVLVEGESDKLLLLGLNKLYRKNKERDILDEEQTMFINCGSANSMPHFYNLYNVFNQYGSFYALFDNDKAGRTARENIIRSGISKELLIILSDSAFKKGCSIEDIVDKSIWDSCLQKLDDKGLVTLKTQQSKIIDYEFLQKDRVKVKKEFVELLLEFAKKDLKPFANYLKIINKLSEQFQSELNA